MNATRFERRLLLRWFARVTIEPSGCWSWRGAHNEGGYSRFSVGRSSVYAHRWGYERFRGPIPEGLELDHVECDQTWCVNPMHVEPSTSAANSLRGTNVAAVNARKTECKHGHPFDRRNTYHRRGGGRSCRTCTRLRMAAHRARR